MNRTLDWAETAMTARDNFYKVAVLVKVQSGFNLSCCEIMQNKSNIIFQVMFYIDEDSNNLWKWKKYHFVEKLQSRELNLVLRKTAKIVRQVSFPRRLFS